MSKALKVVGTVASIAAMIPGPHQPYAAAIAAVATVGSALTAKKPPARGSTSNVLIGANMPIPYTIGRTYVGGNQVHDVGYGGDTNPNRSMVFIWSGAGPIEEIEAFQADFATITFSSGNATGYYNNFLYLSTQLGTSPEASALAGPLGAIPQWGASYKLSGYAAGLATLVFDKKGKRFAAGVPQFGSIIKGVKVYDPRLDSTYPGGAGAQLFDDEGTWEYSDNPALHGIAYARGRYQNGKKVIGCGFSEVGIDLAAWVEFANICDANGWVVGGTLYEPGSKWDNLKRICAAGAAEPVFVGARLSVKFNAPKIALDTITADDLADGEISVPSMKTWRDRKNGIIPKYRSEAHKWEYVQSDTVSVPAYVTEDGEEKEEERQFDLVQDKDQAAQLAAYELVNGREIGPIIISCKPRLMEYVPGEALEVHLPDLGLTNRLCIIVGRKVDPGTAVVELALESETTAKHAYALGLSGTSPPTPTISDGEDLDDIASGNSPRTTTNVVASQVDQLALSAIEGDIAIRTDLSKTYIHNGGTTGTMADWTEFLAPSVTAGLITDYRRGDNSWQPLNGAAVANVPAGNIAATTVQAALNELDTEKAPKASPTFTGSVTWAGGTLNASGIDIAAGFRLVSPAVRLEAATPILTLKDTDSTTPNHVGYINWWDSASATQAELGFRSTGGSFGIDNKVGNIVIKRNGTTIATFDTSGTPGLDIVGEARCDTLRIDVAATAGAKAQTDHIPINVNGVTKYILLGS